jgi:glycerol transport system substrate-binding protein
MGRRVWGHMDYAKVDPSLGWRFTDAWLAMAGVGDKGLPNGQPVDDWGIRAEDCRPVGSSVAAAAPPTAPPRSTPCAPISTGWGASHPRRHGR